MFLHKLILEEFIICISYFNILHIFYIYYFIGSGKERKSSSLVLREIPGYQDRQVALKITVEKIELKATNDLRKNQHSFLPITP